MVPNDTSLFVRSFSSDFENLGFIMLFKPILLEDMIIRFYTDFWSSFS